MKDNELHLKICRTICFSMIVPFVLWAFVALRSNDAGDDTSINCVRNNALWVEPHGISPGYCKK